MAGYPEAYVRFLAHFHGERDYFECHEVLEEYWKETAGSRHSGIWHGLIQVAVALYHERRGNLTGARKMMSAAVRHLREEPLHEVGLDGGLLLALLQGRLAELEEGRMDLVYSDLNLPIADPRLEEAGKRLAAEWGCAWQGPSQANDRFLLNKHTLRDRSGVVRERELAHAQKRGETE